MASTSLLRVAQTVPEAGAICKFHENLLWSSGDYAQSVRAETTFSTAAPDPRWSWPTSEELGRCVVALFGDPAVAGGATSEDVPALLIQLKHPDPCFRLDAISKLGELEAGAAEAAGAIGAVAADKNELPRIRQAAMEAGSSIWGILSYPAARCIAQVGWDAGEDMTLRRSAMEALSAIATNATTRELEDMALDDAMDVSLRVYAVDMIFEAESNNSLDALEELVEIMDKEIVGRALSGVHLGDACSVYQSAKTALECAAPEDDEGE